MSEMNVQLQCLYNYCNFIVILIVIYIQCMCTLYGYNNEFANLQVYNMFQLFLCILVICCYNQFFVTSQSKKHCQM